MVGVIRSGQQNGINGATRRLSPRGGLSVSASGIFPARPGRGEASRVDISPVAVAGASGSVPAPAGSIGGRAGDDRAGPRSREPDRAPGGGPGRPADRTMGRHSPDPSRPRRARCTRGGAVAPIPEAIPGRPGPPIRSDQRESAEMTSPPPMVPRANQVGYAMLLLMNLTEPSSIPRWTPPEW